MILAVLVLYNEKLEQSRTFASLFKTSALPEEAVHLLVYDNSPFPMHAPGSFDNPPCHVHYVSDTSNPGVSRAYNVGAGLAARLGAGYLLLLDQDTVFPQNAFPTYLDAIVARTAYPLFAPALVCDKKIYSPCRHIVNLNLPLKSAKPGPMSAKGLSLLNSGMCIRLDAFDRVGGFDETIPLDFADHDFFKRYKRHFESFFLLDMTCAHGFSDKENRDAGRALARFEYYCQGAKNSIRGIVDVVSLLPLALLHTARLCARFRSLRFLRLLLRTFLGI